MKKTKLLTYSLGGFVLLFLLIWGYSYYLKATTEKLLFRKNELASVTDFKLKQFDRWMQETTSDAESFKKNELLGGKLNSIIGTSGNSINAQTLLPFIDKLKSEFRSKDIWITNSDLKVFYSTTDSKIDSPESIYKKDSINLKRTGITLAKTFFPDKQKIGFVLTIPLNDPSTGKTSGYVFADIAFENELANLFRPWHTPYKSFEILLSDTSDNQQRIIDANCNYREDKKPILDEVEILETFGDSAKFVRAADYQGNDVIAFISQVPSTQWTLIIKLNEAEIYEMVDDRILLITLFALSLLLAVTLILFYLYKMYQQNNSKRLIDIQKQKDILEKNYDMLANHANDMIVRLNDKGEIINLNQKVIETYGYSKEELVGREIFILRADGKSQTAEEAFRKIARPEGIVFEAIHKRKDGSLFPVEVSSKSFLMDGQVFYQSILRDITERKKSESLVRESRKKLSILLSNLPGMAYRCSNDESWTMQYVSRGCFQLTGYKPAELFMNRSIDFNSIILPEFRDMVRQLTLNAIQTKNSFQYTYQIQTKTGEIKWVWCKGRGLFNSNGELQHIEGFVADISKVKSAEEKVLNLNRLYSILSHVNQAIVRTKKKEELYDVLTGLLIKYGKFKLCWIGKLSEDRKYVIPIKSAGEKIGYLDNISFPIHYEDDQLSTIGRALQTRKPVIFNDISLAGQFAVHKNAALEQGFKSAAVFPIVVNEVAEGLLVLYSDELNCFDPAEVGLFEEISTDIAFAIQSYQKEDKRIAAENALKESEENFRQLYESAPLSYQSLDINGNIVEVNKMFNETYGYSKEEIIGKSFSDIVTPEDRTKFLTNFGIFKLNGKVDAELKMIKKNGENIITSINGKVSRDADGNFKQTHCILTDITSQKIAQEKLVEQEESYRTLTNSSLDAIYVLRGQKLLMVNPAWEKMFGYTREEVTSSGFNVMNIVAPESIPFIQNKYDDPNFNLSSSPSKYEFKGITKNGKIIFIDAVVTEIIWKGEKAFQGIYRDITDKKFSEEALRESENRYRQVVENASDLIYTTDITGNFTYANATLLKNLGVTLEEVRSHNFRELVLPEFKNKLVMHYTRQVLEQRPTSYIEFPFRTKLNGIKWFGQNANMKFENGKYVGFHVIARDITLLKEAEGALKENEIKYRALFENNPHPMFVYDLVTLKFQEVNDAAMSHYGYSKEEFLSMTIKDIRPIEDVALLLENIKSSNSKLQNSGIWRHRKKDGTIIYVEIISHDLPQLKEKNSRLVLANDVTEKLQAQKELVKAKEHAEEMNRLKTSFLNNMSHEIRTPMVGILGFTSILLDEVKKPQLKDMCETILNSGKRLMDTINLILDLSRIEANKIEIKVSKIDLVEETQKILKSLSVIAEDKKLKLEFHPSISNAEVFIDRQIYTRIMNNLVGNGLKYTKQGNVTVEIRNLVRNNSNWIEVKVIDSGIGISKESQKYIFDEFRQVSEGLSRQFEGRGLGLTITKRLIELMHGEISVESELGKGSTFTVQIPTHTGTVVENVNVTEQLNPAQKFPDDNQAINQHKPSILLVENDPASIDVTLFFLKNKFILDIALDGNEAVNKAKEKIYDAILMDINLGSGMTGLETTSEIRKLPAYESKPIIALTAFAMEGDKEEFLAGGCSHYLSKPFDKKTIIELLTKLTLKSDY